MAQDHDEIADCMTRCKGENQPFAVATIVRTQAPTAGRPGDKLVIRADGVVTGWVGGACAVSAVRNAAMAALADGRTRLIRICPQDAASDDDAPGGMEIHHSHCPSRGVTELFIEPVLPKPRILIIGTSPVAGALSGLAKSMGYVVSVAGPAADLEAFGDADYRYEDFAIPHGGPAIGHVVVASQGKRDRDCLRAALGTGADYIAFVGSRRKAAKIRQEMIANGGDKLRIDAIRSPAGLHIGAVTPNEIALSILAEIVSERRLGLPEGAPETAATPGEEARAGCGDAAATLSGFVGSN